MSNAVVIREPSEIAVRPNPLGGIDVGALMERAVSAADGVAVLTKLQEMQKEIQAKAAEKAFHEAMTRLKAECPPLVKRRSSSVGKFAPIEDIEAILAPLCLKHGFHHRFDTDTTSDQGWVIVRCSVYHADGHSQTTSVKLPIADAPQNASGKRVTTITQQYAGAMTFASRRALQGAYAVVLVGEDDDCAPKTKPRGPSRLEPDKDALRPLCKELWAAVKATGATTGQEKDWNAVNQYLWKMEFLDAGAEEAAPNLTAEKFRTVIDRVKGVGR